MDSKTWHDDFNTYGCDVTISAAVCGFMWRLLHISLYGD